MNKKMIKEKNIDINKLETIFDHNLTEEELKTAAWGFSKEEYLSEIKSQENHYLKIYYLYLSRNDQKTAMEYFNKLNEKRRMGIIELDENTPLCVIRK